MLRKLVAIVSGGSSGLGAASVSSIIRHGGKVIVADLPSAHDKYLRLASIVCAEASHVRHHQHLTEPLMTNSKQIKKEEETLHPESIISFSPVDVRVEQDIIKALDTAEECFGEPVNVVVNCAGVAIAQKTLKQVSSSDQSNLIDYRPHSLQDFKTCLEVNTLGTFNMTRLAAQRMAQRTPDSDGLRGCIINTASIAAFEGQIGQVAYAASKSAIVGMTLPLARDLAPLGIRVMTIAPGLFKTPLLDGLSESVRNDLAKSVPCPSRLGDPDEFGYLVSQILSNAMLNGSVIRLDGALRMPPK